MTYEEFKNEILKRVEEKLPEDCSVKLKRIDKNNSVSYEGILIEKEGINIAPTINLSRFYSRVDAGMTLEAVTDSILETYENYKLEENFDIEDFLNWKTAKRQLVFKLVNKEKNEKMLKNIPYVEYLDLAIVFCYFMENDSLGGNSSITITNEHVTFWNISVDELMESAMENTPKLLGFKLEHIFDVLRRCNGNEQLVEMLSAESGDIPFYVASNEKNYNGAGVLIYKDAMKALAARFKSDIYIVPCSTHELIILPADEYFRDFCENLREIIRYVNANELEEMDVLSDSLYYYSRSEDVLSIY